MSVTAGDDHLVLRGRVASAEEAAVAAPASPQSVERVEPPEGEVLIGEPDMLSGPDTETTISGRLDRVHDEKIPWDPPDVAIVPPTPAEQAGVRAAGIEGGPGDRGSPTTESPARLRPI